MSTNTKQITVQFYLNEEGRKAYLLAGRDGKKEQETCVSISKEYIEHAYVNSDGEAFIDLRKYVDHNFKLKKISAEKLEKLRNGSMTSEWDIKNCKPEITCESKKIEFDKILTGEEMIAIYYSKVEECQKQREALLNEYNENMSEYEEAAAIAIKILNEEIKKQNEKMQETRKLAELNREKRKNEKADWIKEHGSDYLKKAFSHGYDCQRKYVKERTEFEFPDFILDFDDKLEFFERTCPGEEALNKSIEIEEILKTDSDAYCSVEWYNYQCWNFEHFNEDLPSSSCEAVVIRNYLGKYTLVKFYEE